MKAIVNIITVLGIMFFISGCSTSSKSLNGVSGGSCNNPQCKCEKPCQCGSSCKCGMNGNSATMSGS